MGVVVGKGQMWRGRIPRTEHGVLCRFAVRPTDVEAVSYATDLPAAVGVLVEGYERLPEGERPRALQAAAVELARDARDRMVGDGDVVVDQASAAGRVVLRTGSEWEFLVSLAEAGLVEVSMRVQT